MIVICRTVNYTQIGAKHFKSLDLFDPANTVKTRNFLVQYDRNFNLLSQKEIVENLPRIRVSQHNVEGLEDCRLFEFKIQFGLRALPLIQIRHNRLKFPYANWKINV